jgi:tetratricopeptide (TPR) repeat protein
MIDHVVKAWARSPVARIRLAFQIGTASLVLASTASMATGTSPSNAPPNYAAFVEQAVEASAIADPLQRCLAMPDPPGSHWHAAGVEAYCRYRNYPTLSGAEISQLIAAGKGAAVDKAFEGYLHGQMTDPTQAGLLDVAFNNAELRRPTPAMRKTVNAWMHQRPRSAFAVVASGMQYAGAASIARGSAYASDTTDEQWHGMNTQAALARREFARAAAMTPAVPTMYSDMFGLGRLTGDNEYTIAAMEKGFSLDSLNVAMRLTAPPMSSRKWGGSEGWLLKLEDDARSLAPEHPLLWVAVSRAHIEAMNDRPVCPAPGARFAEAAADVATATAFAGLSADARREHRREDAVIFALESLRFDDSSYGALYTLGQVNSRNIRDPWATDMLRRIAKNHPDNPEVLGVIGGWMYYSGNLKDAPDLLDAAFEHGSRNTWVLSAIGDYYWLRARRYDRAAAVADRLIEVDPDAASGYLLRANVLMTTHSPAQYKAIHAYIDHFSEDPDEREDVVNMRHYLEGHPEPSGNGKTRTHS